MRRVYAAFVLSVALLQMLSVAQGTPARVYITAMRGKEPAKDLSSADIAVLDQKQRLTTVRVEPAGDVPRAIALLIDDAGMKVGGELETDAGVRKVASQLARAADRLFVFRLASGGPSFNSGDIYRAQDRVGERAAVVRTTNMNAGEEVVSALESFAQQSQGDTAPAGVRRIAVIFSGGGVFLSQEMLRKAREIAYKENITVYVMSGDISQRGYGPQVLNTPFLPDLAESTGGEFIEAVDEEPMAYLSRRWNAAFTLTFDPPNADGKLHALDIRIAPEKRIRLQAPRGYIGAKR